MTATLDIGSRLDWAHALESALGIVPNPNDDQTLVAWASAEGGAGPQFGVPNNVTDYNPLNVSLTSGKLGYGYDPGTGAFYPGAQPTPGNTPPIAAFPSWQEGIAATAARLKEPFASGILSDLQAGAPEAQTAQAVGASGWGTGDFAGTTGANAKVVSNQLPGGAADPLNWPQDLLGGAANAVGGAASSAAQSAAGAVWGQVGPFLARAMLVVGGIAVVIVGLFVATKGPRQRATQGVEEVAQAAAPAAAVAA